MGDEKKIFKTRAGIPIPDVPNQDYGLGEPDSEPGSPPYTRGIHKSMYRGKPWTMRQYAGFSSAKETNKRFLTLLQKGQSGLSVAFDLPTQLGLDSDDEMSFGEVGKVGVAIDSIHDMRLLFDGIDMASVSTSMTINAPASILFAMYVAVAEERGSDITELRGTIQNDILKEYIARGTYVFPPTESLRLITDVMHWCKENTPRWNTISISGYHIREAGATAVEELAFTLSNALAYVQAAVDSGLDVDEFAPRLSFFFGCHNDFFEEVAKFRAARKLWYHLMNERFSPSNPKSSILRFHTQTAGVTLTAQQPLNNIVRVSYQALSSVLGGTQSLHTNSFDEAIGLPTDKSSTIALRTQQILANETGIADVVDPLGGSWYVEGLTTNLFNQSKKLIEEIERCGGALSAIESGFQQRHLHESAWAEQVAQDKGELLIVGVNHALDSDAESDMKGQTVDPSLGEAQCNLLSDIRANRDAESVTLALVNVNNAAVNGGNTMQVILDAVKAECTIGEIMNALKGAFGTWMAPSGV
ncbi:MAG TPA: methylmalonyl-CoA mutase [Candidatus Poseidoniales archaeon]|nr:MAG: methylmalonyl-CoA mutase [Euryarchaeota archaeon]HHZ73699.1 methylmalonyl-CoA mutase [Candidatus Poseidoniales archaeon]PXY75532.1 MAG: methylmalonyl-CoA mutase [Euryarchaeota archaeon]PXY79498.1 MAG: methylmalonyl-CoA mutase [Euryarchaeota archaeon]HIA25521.1 methylmalonyl-CoA mutase [Candidatus Poseidoniales archaeon]